jgi:hypothetical protein
MRTLANGSEENEYDFRLFARRLCRWPDARDSNNQSDRTEIAIRKIDAMRLDRELKQRDDNLHTLRAISQAIV